MPDTATIEAEDVREMVLRYGIQRAESVYDLREAICDGLRLERAKLDERTRCADSNLRDASDELQRKQQELSDYLASREKGDR